MPNVLLSFSTEAFLWLFFYYFYKAKNKSGMVHPWSLILFIIFSS